MNYFTYKDIHAEGNKKILEINILPEKICNFDCIFCPIRRNIKTNKQQKFEGLDNSLEVFGKKIQDANPDIIFINSKGEALLNKDITKIIHFIKTKNCKVKLLSNGYLLGKQDYKEIANLCDEVIGEIKTINQDDFQKIQRPYKDYTLNEYINSMAFFKSQYRGDFILEITILKGYNDNNDSIQKLKKIIQKISPDKIEIKKEEDKRLKKRLAITDERLSEIKKEILIQHSNIAWK